jgi:uncharacterized membrane protein
MFNPVLFRADAITGAAGVLSSAPPVTAVRPRLDSIDLLRGVVMVLMTLDHCRDFFGAGSINPRDVADPALFLTRWITHFCAPVFVFLAGVSAFLYGTRGHTKRELSWFLFTRGAWLVLLELTVVRFSWTFSLSADFVVLQVIWAIGVAMIVLSALIHLPRLLIAAVAIAMMAGHNVLDGIHAVELGKAGGLWNVLHEPAQIKLNQRLTVLALYPLIPWIGVMAAGYAFGPVMQLDASKRNRVLLGLGAAALLGFVALRATNAYGEPGAWNIEHDTLGTMLSFVNTEKYPPSALYLMMTLGPAMLALIAFARARGRIAKVLITIGRVPLMYYVAHLLLIHAVAVLLALAVFGDSSWLFGGSPAAKPEGYGYALPAVYFLWLIVVAALYPLCAWFAALKQRRSDWWLSYL